MHGRGGAAFTHLVYLINCIDFHHLQEGFRYYYEIYIYLGLVNIVDLFSSYL